MIAESVDEGLSRSPTFDTDLKSIDNLLLSIPQDTHSFTQITTHSIMGKKRVLVTYGVDVDAVAGWLGSYGGEDSTSDISRGMRMKFLCSLAKKCNILTNVSVYQQASGQPPWEPSEYSSSSTSTTSKQPGLSQDTRWSPSPRKWPLFAMQDTKSDFTDTLTKTPMT